MTHRADVAIERLLRGYFTGGLVHGGTKGPNHGCALCQIGLGFSTEVKRGGAAGYSTAELVRIEARFEGWWSLLGEKNPWWKEESFWENCSIYTLPKDPDAFHGLMAAIDEIVRLDPDHFERPGLRITEDAVELMEVER